MRSICITSIGCSTTQIIEVSREEEEQISQGDCSVMLKHSEHDKIFSFNSEIACDKSKACSLDTLTI